VLVVELPGRGSKPRVDLVKTAATHWHRLEFAFAGDESFVHFETQLQELLGQRAQRDVMELTLSGHLGFAGDEKLRRRLETLEAQLLRLKLSDAVSVLPSSEELLGLTDRQDPLIASMAKRIKTDMESPDPALKAKALMALRELYVLVIKGGAAA